jgi:hypothetical protein
MKVPASVAQRRLMFQRKSVWLLFCNFPFSDLRHFVELEDSKIVLEVALSPVLTVSEI